MKKLYGCKRCNKEGYNEKCTCAGETYELNIGKSTARTEDRHIVDNDIFNRFDHKLQQLQQQGNQLYLNQFHLEKRIKFLEEENQKLNEYLGKINERTGS